MNQMTSSIGQNKALVLVGKIVSSNWFLPVIFAAVYLAWSFNLPLVICPDENLRFAVPNFIISHGFLPNGFEEEIRGSEWGMSYAFSAYGSSLVSLPFMYVVSLFTDDPSALVCASRVSSVLFGALTVYFCLKIGELVFTEPSSKVLLAVICGAMPQFVFLSSYLNCDAISAFSGSLIVYSWIRGVKSAWDFKSCLLLGLGCGICLLSYYFSYGLIVASLFIFIVSTFRHLSPREALKKFALVFLVAFLVAGWFFVRNIIIHDGDIFGMRSLYESRLAYSIPELHPDVRSPQSQGLRIIETFISGQVYPNWFEFTGISFIGKLGYMTIEVPFFIYVEYATIIFTGVVFACFYFLKSKDKSFLILIGLLLAIVIPVMLSMYYSYTTDYQPQGRYLMSALVPLMFSVVWGIDMFVKNVGRRFKALTYLPIILSAAIIASLIICFFVTIIPLCCGPVLGPAGTSH